MTYELNTASARASVDKILDIRSASYTSRGSYVLPEEFKGRHFVRQIGLSPRSDRALIFLQPAGVYVPDFRYGPITGRIEVSKKLVELKGDYERFPKLSRYSLGFF